MSRFDILNSRVAQDLQRGLLKLYILRIVRDEKMHGYGIMDRLGKITKSKWRPSPGSMYPALRSLEKFGLIKSIIEKNRRVYTITPNGRLFLRHIGEHVDQITSDIKALFSPASAGKSGRP